MSRKKGSKNKKTVEMVATEPSLPVVLGEKITLPIEPTIGTHSTVTVSPNTTTVSPSITTVSPSFTPIQPVSPGEVKENGQIDPLLKVFIEDRIVANPLEATKVPETPQTSNTNTPRIKERQPNGLLEGVEYQYLSNGRIDWQKMFNPEHFYYINGDKTKEPLLKVDGLRELAEIRGIVCKSVAIQPVSENMVICKVYIQFIPNVDDKGGREWEATADATPHNIAGKTFNKFLTAMAETRAMGRCIKEALGIRLCTYEEMSKDDLGEQDNGTKPVSDELVAAITRQCEIKGVKTDELTAKITKDFPSVVNVQQLTMEQASKILTFLNEKQNATKV